MKSRITGIESEGMKFDTEKLRMDLLPFDTLEDISKVLTYGAKKYKPNNWQLVDNAEERYEAALIRHLSAYKQGEVIDSESGLTHLSHLACNALFLIHFQNKKLKNINQ